MIWIALILMWIIPIIISLVVVYYSMNKGESVSEFTMRANLDDEPLILLFVPLAGIIEMFMILNETLCIKIKQWRK